MKFRTLIAKIFQVICYWFFYCGFKFHTRFKIEGQENLNGLADKAVIFASNHFNEIDPAFCAASVPCDFFGLFPWKFYPIRFLAYKEFFEWNNRFPFPLSIIVALYVRLNGSISVDRKAFPKDLDKILVNAVAALKNGDKVWIFPEGKMSKDGKIAEKCGRGVAYLHQQTNAPIVPVGIKGTYGLSFKNLMTRKNKVTIKIGKPIYKFSGNTLEEIVSEAMDEVKVLAG